MLIGITAPTGTTVRGISFPATKRGRMDRDLKLQLLLLADRGSKPAKFILERLEALEKESMAENEKTIERGNVVIMREGDKIIIPQGMDYKAASTWLIRAAEADEKTVAPYARIGQAHPMDTLVAFHKALKEIYGFTDLLSNPGFFGDTPPAMLNIQTSATTSVEVPWGNVTFPGLEGTLGVGMDWSSEPALNITGKIKQKCLPEYHRIIDKTKEVLRRASIYKGKAINLSWQWKRTGEAFNPLLHGPKFMSLASVGDDSLIFSEEVMRAITVGLFVPIEHSQRCRDNNIPLKRGILLYGPYGCGKTLSALVTARKAEQHGWTFIYLDSVHDLEEGLKFAANYTPAVLFVEDIDKALKAREIEQDTILNLLDGINTKRSELITVFTTNFVKQLDPAFCRPGRLDTIVEVKPPNRDAAARLAKYYGGNLVADNCDWDQVGTALQNKIPSMIEEIMHRAKLAAMVRTADSLVGSIGHEDILTAAEFSEAHAKLFETPPAAEDAKYQITLQPEQFTRVNPRRQQAESANGTE
jgi:transitional endoplasmic reticulum ATPase